MAATVKMQIVTGGLLAPTVVAGTVSVPAKIITATAVAPTVVAGTVSVPAKIITATAVAPTVVYANIVVPSHRPPTTVVATGGARVAGRAAPVVFGGRVVFLTTGGAVGAAAEQAEGGARGAGTAVVVSYAPARMRVVGAGGARGSGLFGVVFTRPHVTARLPRMTSLMAEPNPFNRIYGRLPLSSASINASADVIAAGLTSLSSTILVWVNPAARVAAGLPTVSSILVGGVHKVDARLPAVACAFLAGAGGAGEVSASLPTLVGSTSGLPGGIGAVSAALPASTASAAGVAGLVSSINASLAPPRAYAASYAGLAGAIAGTFPVSASSIEAGFGAVGSIGAWLPRTSAKLGAPTPRPTQQAVLVINTRTNALSTYEQYPFNSFCELGGVYYGAGPNGLCRIDVGDDDAGAPISAGLSTGLLSFKDPHQKRMTDAYMTLRTAGDLVLTTTVDEAATYSAVAITLPAQTRTEFIQRRVAIPQGLRGKSWQFELSNTAGADFDFGHLGLNIAPCARRI